MDTTSSLAIYTSPSGKVELTISLEGETLWLSQKQMAELFDIDQSVVARHLRGVFESGELREEGSMQKMHKTPGQGGRPTTLYNLDAVISVGYRANSKRATQFRIWATSTLRHYLLDGYLLNQKRLLEVQAAKLKELQEVVRTVTRLAGTRQLAGQEGELLELIDQYAHSWKVLEEYDSNAIETARGSKERFQLTHDLASRLVGALRHRVSEDHALFGQEIYGKFKGIIGAIGQTFNAEDLYPSTEEKAAHLFYFVIKDHPFLDGNKRIASLLFMYYLRKNRIAEKRNGETKINDNALAALALLVAGSAPTEKPTMIKLVVNLLQNS